jgi:inorganic pyrophosphatase
VSELPELTLERIAHFFEHYKDLEKGKWVKIEGWKDAKAAKQEILAAMKRFDEMPAKDRPRF